MGAIAAGMDAGCYANARRYATLRRGGRSSNARKKVAGNAADQQGAQPAASPVATNPPARPDLLSTLAYRQDQSVTLTLDEAAGVEMTREWRERAKEFESQNMTDGAVQFRWPAEIPSIVCAVLQVTDVALEPGEAITSVSTGDNLRWSVEAVVSGEGPAQQPHLIIKPFDRGMTTSVVVTTTRRSLSSHAAFDRPAVHARGLVHVPWRAPKSGDASARTKA